MAAKKDTNGEEKPKPFHDGIDEGGAAYKEVEYLGQKYRMHQIGVPEADEAWNAAFDEKAEKMNWRLYNRTTLAMSIVSPVTTVDDLLTWTNAKLVYFLGVYDILNNLGPADLQGN